MIESKLQANLEAFYVYNEKQIYFSTIQQYEMSTRIIRQLFTQNKIR